MHRSLFLRKIPMIPELLQSRFISHSKTTKHTCKCDSNCLCHRDGSSFSSCPCIVDGAMNCDYNCLGCINVTNKGFSDNRQIRNGEIININYEKVTGGIVTKEDVTAGDYLLEFIGEVVPANEASNGRYEENVRDLGEIEFELMQNYGEFTKGHKWRGKWVLDSSKHYNDGNYIKYTCNNNNSACYIVSVDGLMHCCLYATARIEKGMFFL